MARPAFLTTSWDDGHPLDLRVADLLARHNLRGTFYVPRDTPTGTMDEFQIRNLSAQFEIGAHTLDHVFLTRCTDPEAEQEIVDSKRWVEQVTGKACTMFCPPRGEYKRSHLALMERAGYRGLRTVELLSLDPPRRRGSLYEMPTTLHAYPHPPLAYVRNAAKRAAASNLLRYLLHGGGRDWTRLAEPLLRRVATRGGVFHLWGHSWEIDQTAGWRRLEDVLRMMSDHAIQAPCLTNGEICRQIEPRAARSIAGPAASRPAG